MKATKAGQLYEENWDRNFTTYDELFSRIKSLAENGADKLYVRFEDSKKLTEVKTKLEKLEYDVENYWGGINILEISF